MTFNEYISKYHISLNAQQTEAVQTISGQTLLLAVPGSGKTTVVITRVGYLILVHKVKASSILTITFSKAAAIEMKERFAKKFGSSIGTPKFSTIHSLCVSILNYAKKMRGIKIPKLEQDNKRIIRKVLYDATNIWPQDNLVTELTLLLANAKNRLLTEEQIDAIKCFELSREYKGVSFSDFYHMYEKYKQDNELMDFDDQLLMAYDVLLNYGTVLNHFQHSYPHIGVDEAQDTSLLQFEIIRLLSYGAQSLFVVGDDDQSIYGFRGADPANILQFTETFMDAKVLYMETNYRNAAEIVSASNRFIGGNKLRFNKTAVANNHETGTISISTKETERGVYNEITRHIQDIISGDRTLAVLSRNNYTLLPLVVALDEAGVVVRKRDNFENYFRHPLILSITSILRLSAEPWNIEAFRQCRGAMKLYINNKQMSQIEEVVKESSLPETEQNIIAIAEGACASAEYTLDALDVAKKALALIKDAVPETALRIIEQHFGRHLDSSTASYFYTGPSTYELYFGTFVQFAEHYKTIPELLKAIEHYSEQKTDSRNAKSNVTLSTIFSAKGLEFDDIIILDAIDGILPQFNTEDKEDDNEEEARLFYVAVTRAKSSVMFTVPKTLYGTSVTPSPFIAQLLPPPPDKEIKKATKSHHDKAKPPVSKPVPKEIMIGMRISHKTFGEGTVIEKGNSEKANIVVVNFDKEGRKRLLASFCTPI